MHTAPLADDVRADIARDSDAPLDQETDRGPHRRCVATGVVAPKEILLRFVIGPSGTLVPDLQARLPGRGLYLTASRAAIETALKKRAFSKAARGVVDVPSDLADQLETMVAGRAIELLGLARRAGQAVLGYDQVAAWLKANRGGVLLQAADAAPGGRARLAALAGERTVVEVLRAAELAQPFGRDHVVHVAVAAGGLATRLEAELARLAGLRRTGSES